MRWRRRRRQPSIHRWIAFFAVTRVAAWYNPWSWVKYAAGVGGYPLGGLGDWVVNVIVQGLNLVENDVLDVFNWARDQVVAVYKLFIDGLNNVYDSIAQAGRDILGWVGAGIQRVYDWINHQVSAVLDWIGAGLQGVYNWIAHQVGQILQWVEGELAQLGQWIEQSIEWAIHTAEQAAKDLWDFIWSNFLGPLLAPLIWLYDHAKSIVVWFEHGVIDVWHIIEKALGWLIWFAEHPIEAIDDIETTIADDIKAGVPGAWTSGANRWAARVEHAVGEWLGIK